MGRGRAKAKQTKVARELKYSAGRLDPDRLKAELAAGSPFPVAAPAGSGATDSDDDDDEFTDPYADDDEDDEDR